MRQKKELADLSKLTATVVFPKPAYAFDVFLGKLRGLVADNFDAAFADSLTWDSDQQVFTLERRVFVAMFNETRFYAERTFTLSPTNDQGLCFENHLAQEFSRLADEIWTFDAAQVRISQAINTADRRRL